MCYTHLLFVTSCVIKIVFTFSRYFPKSKKAAALFLYNLWSDKELQSFLKKVREIYPITSRERVWVCPVCFLSLYFILIVDTPLRYL